MKSIVSIAVILVTICAVSTLGGRADFPDPEYPGKCAINDRLILSPGEEARDPYQLCGRIICFDNGIAEFQTCSQPDVECGLGKYLDLSLPFPDCCKREKLPCDD